MPIIPDEARTFGMDSFFPTAKIYNPKGQHYTAVDRELFLAYKESEHGQILHAGINEAGSMAAFTAAGTAYATHGEPMIPVYVFYSMFGFQRTGDSMWAAMDQMARGFIIGATAGRTTLTGEGLQHADGHSPILGAMNPAMKVYDPAFGYEIAHIVRAGLEQMYGPDSTDPNVMYYLTVYNEPMQQPAEPEGSRRRGDRPRPAPDQHRRRSGPKVQLLGSGVSVPWAQEAAMILGSEWGVSADVWSVTSWTELRRDGLAAARAQLPASRRGQADPVRDDASWPTRADRSSPRPTTSPTCPIRSGSSCRTRSRPWAPTTTASPTPGRRRGATSTSTPTRWSYAPCSCSPTRARSTPSVPKQAAEKYQLLDVRAGTTGNAGGES